MLAILAECSRSRILSTTKSTINIVSTRVGVFLFPDSTTGNKITNFAEEAGHQHYVTNCSINAFHYLLYLSYPEIITTQQ